MLAILSLTNASSAGTLDLIDEPPNALGGKAAAPATANVLFTNSLLFFFPFLPHCLAMKYPSTTAASPMAMLPIT